MRFTGRQRLSAQPKRALGADVTAGKAVASGGQSGGWSWLDRLVRLRDRILANPRFQRRVSDLPVANWIAHSHASALFDICAGFVYSQVLAACIRLRLFEMLQDGPETPADLAARCAMPAEAMQRLLAAAAALGLVAERSGGRYGLGMLGAALIGNPGIAAMVEHHSMLYDDLRDPVALLRGDREATQLARYWPYAAAPSPGALDGASTAGYTALMSSSQDLIAEDILAAYDFRRHRRLLDIGGGNGAFLAAAAARAPQLSLTLFDLPAVAAMAAARFKANGLSGRTEAVGGDFFTDLLPEGADLVTLIRIILDHDDAAALRILRAARRAIAPGGTLLIAEPLSGLTGSKAVSDAYFGMYLFAMGRGRPRRFKEMKTLLQQAGFKRIRAVPTRRPLLTNLLVASPDPVGRSDNLC